MIRALLIDDEAIARKGVRFQLQQYDDVRVVAEAGDGPGAVDTISRFRPDLVFLDIHIPGFDGFEVIRRVSSIHLPVVIFVTAYDSSAVQAFDTRALDYLVKPINGDRFRDAMARARQMLIRSHQPTYYHRFTVRQNDRFVVINAADVDWFQTASNYVQLHVAGREHLLRTTLNELEQKLDPRRFVRIHRSTLVNLERISCIQPTHNGDFNVLLTDGSLLRLSR